MPMDPIFLLIAIFTLGAAVSIFLFDRIIHAVIALTAAFFGSSLVFLFLGQVFAALLQLFVLVGGLSTYLIVAVATEERNKNRITPSYFFIIAVLSALVLSTSVITSGSGPVGNNSFLAAATAAFQSYYLLFYAVVFLLFSTALGSILIIKRFIKLVV